MGGAPGGSVRARADRSQQAGLGKQLEVVADGGGRYLVPFHQRDVPGRERFVCHRERAQGADPKRMGKDPEGARELRVGVRAVVPALLEPHGA